MCRWRRYPRVFGTSDPSRTHESYWENREKLCFWTKHSRRASRIELSSTHAAVAGAMLSDKIQSQRWWWACADQVITLAPMSLFWLCSWNEHRRVCLLPRLLARFLLTPAQIDWHHAWSFENECRWLHLGIRDAGCQSFWTQSQVPCSISTVLASWQV